jgi:hypothetical protein
MRKRLDQMRHNPQGDWKIADVEALCAECGLGCAAPRGGGSHYRVWHPSVPTILTIPSRRPIKPIYSRKLVQMIDAVRTALGSA